MGNKIFREINYLTALSISKLGSGNIKYHTARSNIGLFQPFSGNFRLKVKKITLIKNETPKDA